MTRQTVYLGFDLATITGWGLLDANGARIDSGWRAFPVKTTDGARWGLVRRWMLERLDHAAEHGEPVVGYELVMRHAATRAGHVYGGFEAYLQEVCDARGLRLVPVTVGGVKVHATGKGNADKSAMVLAARKRWGYPTSSAKGHEDEADALHIASLTLEQA